MNYPTAKQKRRYQHQLEVACLALFVLVLLGGVTMAGALA